MPRLETVFDAPERGTTRWPWEVAAFAPASRQPLGRSMSQEELGAVVARLVSDNVLPDGPSVAETLTPLLEREALALSGGLRVLSDSATIEPGCCSGVENWRDWYRVLDGGRSPWLGHHPTPWLERVGDHVVVWAEGGLKGAPEGPSIQFSEAELKTALEQVRVDLDSFVSQVRIWSSRIGFEETERLSALLTRSLRVTPNHAPPENDRT
jgi:hypothetical protein